MNKLFLPLFFVIVFLPFYSEALSPSEERALLEQELRVLEEQIENIEGDITKTEQEKKTFQNEVSILRNRIRKLGLQIEKSTVIIGDLREQITDTTDSISKTEADIIVKKIQLGEVLQRVYQEDKKSIAEIMFTGSELSDFFNNIAALDALSTKNRELLRNIEELSLYLKDQKGALESEKGEEENFVRIQILQKTESQNTKINTEYLLEVTKGKESEYKRLLADKQAEASKIRSRIFDLIGVSKAPTFGEAVAIAQMISSQTGVRAALLLAVLTQESSIGKNVGQCYLTDVSSGDGVTIKGTYIRKVMKPTRDVQPFLKITRELGMDPFTTPVSCPIPSVGGFGGAMGPAQFIPSTWIIFKDRMAAIKGTTPNPWDIRDAFLASAVYLGELGATKQTYEHEWCAALSYFSGNCSLRNQVRYEFYGDSVMAIAARYEQDIKTLQGN